MLSAELFKSAVDKNDIKTIKSMIKNQISLSNSELKINHKTYALETGKYQISDLLYQQGIRPNQQEADEVLNLVVRQKDIVEIGELLGKLREYGDYLYRIKVSGEDTPDQLKSIMEAHQTYKLQVSLPKTDEERLPILCNAILAGNENLINDLISDQSNYNNGELWVALAQKDDLNTLQKIEANHKVEFNKALETKANMFILGHYYDNLGTGCYRAIKGYETYYTYPLLNAIHSKAERLTKYLCRNPKVNLDQQLTVFCGKNHERKYTDYLLEAIAVKNTFAIKQLINANFRNSNQKVLTFDHPSYPEKKEYSQYSCFELETAELMLRAGIKLDESYEKVKKQALQAQIESGQPDIKYINKHDLLIGGESEQYLSNIAVELMKKESCRLTDQERGLLILSLTTCPKQRSAGTAYALLNQDNRILEPLLEAENNFFAKDIVLGLNQNNYTAVRKELDQLNKYRFEDYIKDVKQFYRRAQYKDDRVQVHPFVDYAQKIMQNISTVNELKFSQREQAYFNYLTEVTENNPDIAAKTIPDIIEAYGFDDSVTKKNKLLKIYQLRKNGSSKQNLAVARIIKDALQGSSSFFANDKNLKALSKTDTIIYQPTRLVKRQLSR